jgi:PAS domain S-box-containing protein
MTSLQPGPQPPDQSAAMIRAEQLGLLFDTLPFNNFGAVVVAAIVAVTLWPVSSHRITVLWYTAIVITSCGRAALAFGCRRDPLRQYRTSYWRRCFISSSVISGAVWGLGNFLLFPATDLSKQMLLVFITSGISAAAAVSLSADRKIVWSFLIPCTLPLVLQFYRYQETIGIGVSAMGLLYLVFIAGVINRLHNYVNDNIALRIAAAEREQVRNEYAQALHASREKLQALFELSPLGCALSTVKGEVIEANAALEQLLGFRATDRYSLDDEATTPEPFRAENKRRWQVLIEHGGTDSFEREYIRKDGSSIAASVHRMAVDTGAGRYVWSLIENISARKVALAQLAASREQFAAFIEYVPAAVTMLDREMNCVACSRRWADEAHLKIEEIVGHNHYQLFPWLSQEAKEMHRRCLSGAIERSDAEMFVWPNGRVIWSRWEVRPWYDINNEIGGIVVFNEDITARREAEQALRARDELLKKLTERVPGYIYQYCIAPDGTPTFRYVSAAVRDIYELEPEELYANPRLLFQRFHPDDIDSILTPAPVGPDAPTKWNADYRVCLPQKGVRWVHGDAVGERQADGTLVWHGYVSDITERKRTEEQLQILNSRLSLAAHAGGIGVWEWDLVGDKLLWDARMHEIFKVQPQDLSTQYIDSMIHPDDWRMSADNFIAALHDPKTDRYVAEYRIILSDDTERAIRMAGIFQRDAAGRTLRMIGVTWDITEVKKVERMKSEFISTVSHELRTPLTSIRGSLGLVASGVAGELPPAALELIEAAYKNSERLSLLINDILDIEKIESGKMRVDLKQQALLPLIEQAIAANQGYAQTFAVELKLVAAADAAVTVDANRLMQVMANFISNAVKFSETSGVVEIAIELLPQRARVEVRDRGPGISADFRERIFQRFSQADASDARARGGSGLGLAITKAILEKMQGEIGFTARVGGGTVFFFDLPRHNPLHNN